MIDGRQVVLRDMLDPVSARLLPVIRTMIASLQGMDTKGWQTSFALAVETWGEARGLAIAYRAQLFLTAMLRRRPVPLRIADPDAGDTDQALTEDECVVLALLVHIRDDESYLARHLLVGLIGGNGITGTFDAARDLCAVLDNTHGAMRGKAVPPLRIVG